MSVLTGHYNAASTTGQFTDDDTAGRHNTSTMRPTGTGRTVGEVATLSGDMRSVYQTVCYVIIRVTAGRPKTALYQVT